MIQLQEDMKRQLSAEGNYTEAELEEYMQSHKKLMIDSLWKLNVADIELTISRVCQTVRLGAISLSVWPFLISFINSIILLIIILPPARTHLLY